MNRNAMIISVAVTFLGVMLLGVYIRQFQRETSGGAPIALLAMRQDIAAGVPLTEQMLVVRRLPESYVETRQVLASDLPRVLGVRASIPLEANQTLLWTDLAGTLQHRAALSTRIPRGMRAMAVAGVGRSALGSLIRPGDRVDVLLTKTKPGPETNVVTVPLLQNVLVLAVGDDVDPMNEEVHSRASDSVTLLLTVDQASLLAQARQSSTLSLALRNENDLAINEGLTETDDSDILELEKRASRQRRLRIEKVD